MLADEIGVDVIALGEHHRPEYSISTPETVLAGIATRTEPYPARLRRDRAELRRPGARLPALRHRGRALQRPGRGHPRARLVHRVVPAVRLRPGDYDVLFEEKIELFAKLLDEKPVTWSGTTRAALDDADVFPKTESGRLTTWVGVGGSPQSVVRTARYGFPLMLAIIGGAPDRFAPYVDLYRRATEQFGTTAHPVGMHSPGFIADTDEEAKELLLAPLPGHPRPHRRAARLAAGPPGGVRRRDRARLPLHRLARDGRPQDRPRRPAHSASAGSTSSTPPARSRPAPACAPSSCTAPR